MEGAGKRKDPPWRAQGSEEREPSMEEQGGERILHGWGRARRQGTLQGGHRVGEGGHSMRGQDRGGRKSSLEGAGQGE